MDQEITRIDRIKLEARAAAAKHTDVNAACPYPWDSPAAITFKREFDAAKTAAAESQFCTCDLSPTLQELDTWRCGACGKEIVP